jgi:hypothetical protein
MDFASTLDTLRRKSGTTCYRLAKWSGLSEAYIYRLERRQRVGPTRDVVIMLGLALVRNGCAVEIWDVDELLLSAGYAPLRRRGENPVRGS